MISNNAAMNFYLIRFLLFYHFKKYLYIIIFLHLLLTCLSMDFGKLIIDYENEEGVLQVIAIVDLSATNAATKQRNISITKVIILTGANCCYVLMAVSCEFLPY
jgi:hypothetical protein